MLAQNYKNIVINNSASYFLKSPDFPARYPKYCSGTWVHRFWSHLSAIVFDFQNVIFPKKSFGESFLQFRFTIFSRFQNFSRFGPNLILSQKSHQNVFLLNAYEHQWEVWTIRVFTLFSRYKLQRLCSHRKVSALTEEKFVRRNGRVGLRKKEREI